jgi:hypothetical protein
MSSPSSAVVKHLLGPMWFSMAWAFNGQIPILAKPFLTFDYEIAFFNDNETHLVRISL